MNIYPDTRFFLGANTENGFLSMYNNFVDSKNGDFLFVIKGGPGCGKSTFMKRLAENMKKENISAEMIRCSGDPGSLDGVYFPEIRTAFVDGTAPHIIEPPYPAAGGSYINMGSLYNCAQLQKLLPEIENVTLAYKNLYAKAYDSLGAAGVIFRKIYPTPEDEDTVRKIEKRAKSIIKREIRKNSPVPGKIKYRFISAISCDGIIHEYPSVSALAEKIITIDGSPFLAHLLIEQIKSAAITAGHDVILCPSPFINSYCEAVIISSLSLAFIFTDKKDTLPFAPHSCIHMNSMIPKQRAKDQKLESRNFFKAYKALMDDALCKLSLAGKLHDELEGIYRPFVDFGGADRLVEEFTELLKSKCAERG